MKFRTIEIDETREGSPYLLITHPTIKTFHSIRCKEARTGFRKNYKFCNGTFKSERWGKHFYIYKLIPFHVEPTVTSNYRGSVILL